MLTFLRRQRIARRGETGSTCSHDALAPPVKKFMITKVEGGRVELLATLSVDSRWLTRFPEPARSDHETGPSAAHADLVHRGVDPGACGTAHALRNGGQRAVRRVGTDAARTLRPRRQPRHPECGRARDRGRHRGPCGARHLAGDLGGGPVRILYAGPDFLPSPEIGHRSAGSFGTAPRELARALGNPPARWRAA